LNDPDFNEVSKKNEPTLLDIRSQMFSNKLIATFREVAQKRNGLTYDASTIAASAIPNFPKWLRKEKRVDMSCPSNNSCATGT